MKVRLAGLSLARPLLEWTLYLAYLGVFLLAVFELLYRTQLIDFYRPELNSYNAGAIEHADSHDTVLVFGDSFSAGLSTYVALLRTALPNAVVVNSAIGGSGAVQAHLIARRRFASFEPSVVIYQVYVGNDLFDIRYSSNRAATGLTRWAYWNVATHLRSIGWLNYRLAQVRAGASRGEDGRPTAPTRQDVLASIEPDPHEAFSPELYTPRQKIMIAAEPALVESTVQVAGERRADYEAFVGLVRETLTRCTPGACRAYVLVVPHKMQASREYLTQYRELGASVHAAAAVMSLDYPFVTELAEGVDDLGNVKVLNPLGEVQRREADGVRLYYHNDEHMNQQGQLLLFETVLAQLQADGIGA